MYGEIEWTAARELFDGGMSKAGIARRLGMSRTTVARLLKLQAPPRKENDSAIFRKGRVVGPGVCQLPCCHRSSSRYRRSSGRKR